MSRQQRQQPRASLDRADKRRADRREANEALVGELGGSKPAPGQLLNQLYCQFTGPGLIPAKKHVCRKSYRLARFDAKGRGDEGLQAVSCRALSRRSGGTEEP